MFKGQVCFVTITDDSIKPLRFGGGAIRVYEDVDSIDPRLGSLGDVLETAEAFNEAVANLLKGDRLDVLVSADVLKAKCPHETFDLCG